jgi:hypothetical protein
MRLPRRTKGRAQDIDMVDQDARVTIRKRRREEERAACKEIPPVSNHAASISRLSLRSSRATP